MFPSFKFDLVRSYGNMKVYLPIMELLGSIPLEAESFTWPLALYSAFLLVIITLRRATSNIRFYVYEI